MKLRGLALNIAQGVIIHDGITRDVFERFFFGYAVRTLSDDYGQLSLIVQLLGTKFRDINIVIRAREGICKFNEEGRVLGKIPVHFPNVFGIV